MPTKVEVVDIPVEIENCMGLLELSYIATCELNVVNDRFLIFNYQLKKKLCRYIVV